MWPRCRRIAKVSGDDEVTRKLNQAHAIQLNSSSVTDPKRGYFTANYVSSIDDSEQPFALWVPTTYSPSKSYPLIVALHGMDANERMILEECFHIPQRGFSEDVILLSPFGRGDIGYGWMGEADIWDTINWVKARYRVDARRQYLTGLSMGGFACWRLACDYPEQWAAIAPVCGGGNPAAVSALKKIPVWCVHGDQDQAVPVHNSRAMIAALRHLKSPHRYDELPGWGHNSWEWLYDPERKKDSLADWFLGFQKATAAPAVLKPQRRDAFKDLFHERVIISYPARTLIPKEVEILRNEAERIAHFSFGDGMMRRGKLLVRTDLELTSEELSQANHLMLGRTDNHHRLNQAERKLRLRHVRGQLRVEGQTYLGKTLVAASAQASPWNCDRLLGVITYQQVHQMRGIAERFFNFENDLPSLSIYDRQQERFIYAREAKS